VVEARLSGNGLIRFQWRAVDEYRGLTLAAIAGGLVALGMARFGLPPVDIHLPLHYLGVMDPLCGMTRAVTATARGDITTALVYNPGILLLGLGAGCLYLRVAIGLVSGQWLAVTLERRRTMIMIAVLMTLALWVNQQMHADLLMQFGIMR
jgi:hypothetical protein